MALPIFIIGVLITAAKCGWLWSDFPTRRRRWLFVAISSVGVIFATLNMMRAYGQDCRVQVPHGNETYYGSGVLVQPALVVTNAHVVESMTAANCQFKGTWYRGQVLCRDAIHDLAAIKLETEPDVSVAKLGFDGDNPIGGKCRFVGYAPGVERELQGTMIQFVSHVGMVDNDAARFSFIVSQGDSGGAVYNADGKVVAINNCRDGRIGITPQWSQGIRVGIVRRFLFDSDWKYRTR